MAAYSELVVEQGASFTTTVNVNDVYGNPLSLVDHTAKAQYKKSYQATTAYNMIATITNGLAGEITLALTSQTTANIAPGRYVYDLIVYDSNPLPDVTRVVEGVITVLPAVTTR